MKYCYVVSGFFRFQDLGDAIEEAKKILFQKLKLRGIKSPIFTMRKGENRIIVKATYDYYGNKSMRGSRSVSIRCDSIKPSSNIKLLEEYSKFSL